MKYFAYYISIFVVITILVSLYIVGSTQHARQIRFDEQRISNLQEIQNNISWYYDQNDTIPEQLTELTTTYPEGIVLTDPETGKPYEYMKTGETTYQLSTTFNQTQTSSYINRPVPIKIAAGDSWYYTVGRNCFDREVKKSITQEEMIHIDRSAIPVPQEAPIN